MAQLAKYRLEPYCYELFCDCGEKMRADFNLGGIFMSLVDKTISTEYKYICPKCKKVVISDTNYELGEAKFKYVEVLEVNDLPMTEDTANKEA